MIIMGSALLLCTMSFFTGLLITEYLFFKGQAQRMLELQEEYQECIQTFKQSLYEKHHDEASGSTVACNIENQKEFDVVNREFFYLRDCALGFGKIHNLEKVVKPLYDCGTWDSNYAEAIANHLEPRTRIYQREKRRSRKQQSSLQSFDFTLSWPIERSQFWISSKFGPRKKSFHYGIDMAALTGTPVYAALEGRVTEASYAPKGYGKVVVIEHKKCKTRYAHLNDIYVKVGQYVDKTKPIGCVGSTGFVRGKIDASHLHFEVMDLFGKRINPLYILK